MRFHVCGRIYVLWCRSTSKWKWYRKSAHRTLWGSVRYKSIATEGAATSSVIWASWSSWSRGIESEVLVKTMIQHYWMIPEERVLEGKRCLSKSCVISSNCCILHKSCVGFLSPNSSSVKTIEVFAVWSSGPLNELLLQLVIMVHHWRLEQMVLHLGSHLRRSKTRNNIVKNI